jgi:hypothetical protein
MAKLVRVGLIGVLGLLAAACGDDSSGSCGPGTCSGCCTASGRCVPTPTVTNCGKGGKLCVACGTGEQCLSGTCQATQECTKSNCPTGCCQGDECLPGDNPNACGADGDYCQACGPDKTCSNGKCVGAPCDATTCPNGCCYNGSCFPGDNASLCGKGGAPCQACSQTQSCIEQACTTGGPCDATTCASGCCLNGECQPGTGLNACGKGGGPCVKCGSGEQCKDQVCQKVTCGPTTCPNGCCDQAGNCQPGTSGPLCGKGGAQCQACGPNQACQSQTCVNIPPPACSPTTCPNGCCDQAGKCQPGTSTTACGKGGAPCQACGTNLACSNQKCTCTPASCSNGCCQGDTCRSGTESSACGKNGAPCQACQSPMTCLNQVCSSECSFLSCTGCCDTAKVCHIPGNNSNCGLFGNPCQACASGSDCDTSWGNCNNDTACNSASCPKGCCKNGKCEPGTYDAACGDAAGGVCETCGGTTAPHLYCGTDPLYGMQCIATTSSTWDVLLEMVEVKDGVDWDDFLEGGNPPELLVKFTVAGVSGQAGPAAEGYVGNFNNAYLLTAKTSDLAAKIHYEIYDKDNWSGDELVAKCDDLIYPTELKWGRLWLSQCGGDPNNANFVKIVFRFKIKAP